MKATKITKDVEVTATGEAEFVLFDCIAFVKECNDEERKKILTAMLGEDWEEFDHGHLSRKVKESLSEKVGNNLVDDEKLQLFLTNIDKISYEDLKSLFEGNVVEI